MRLLDLDHDRLSFAPAQRKDGRADAHRNRIAAGTQFFNDFDAFARNEAELYQAPDDGRTGHVTDSDNRARVDAGGRALARARARARARPFGDAVDHAARALVQPRQRLNSVGLAAYCQGSLMPASTRIHVSGPRGLLKVEYESLAIASKHSAAHP